MRKLVASPRLILVAALLLFGCEESKPAAHPPDDRNVDRYGAREQVHAIREQVLRECTRYMLEPGTHVTITLDPATGAATSAKISSDNVGEVGKCIEEKFARVKVEPFTGEPGIIEVDLGRGVHPTNKVPHP